MACSSDGYPPSEQELWMRKAVPAACEMAKILTDKQRSQLSGKTQLWIKIHEKYDREAQEERKAKRQVRELKQSAISKLSRAERSALRL